MIASIPLVDLKAQHAALKQEIGAAMARVIDSTSFIMGPELEAFEADFAAYCQAKHAIGVGTGTAALELTLRALGIGPGDEVITTPFTFIATAEAISQVGAIPVFADIDPGTYNIRPEAAEAAITTRTKAIMPVHLYGQPADMAPLLEITRQHGLRLIEDSAQAHGALYGERRAGSMGDAGCFSFYPSKNLGCYGDGGGVITNDAHLAGRVRKLRDHGRTSKYVHDELGYGQRLDTLQAAILRAKLPHLDTWNQARRHLADRYDRLLAGTDLLLPHVSPGTQAVYHLYVVRTPRRDKVLSQLGQQGIGAGIHYPLPVHLQPAYRHLGLGPGSFPAAEAAAEQVLSLPLYPEMTDEQQDRVAEALLQVLEG